ncbi:amylo-alpha-1,6-glucosidase [Almyronema epifaneia]|uniref:Amylo-alpha-1,6-glucosidase n=1 Tax=Almyronema epifaneia S1 TaxID=2991925 RepID=A0ABW6IGR3_9CYAN
MTIEFGREICGYLPAAERREWLVTNGIGGYAAGTVAGLLTRRYHGLLVAALKPPLGRTLLVTKADETILYDGRLYPLYVNRWGDGSLNPRGDRLLESFHLEGTLPVWRFACGDALLDKQIWMPPGENTTYVRYCLHRASQPLTLSLKVLVNYRDYHGDTQAKGWQMAIAPVSHGLRIQAFATAVPFYLFCDRAHLQPTHQWHYRFDLALERYRGLRDQEDHLQVATVEVLLAPNESITLIASTAANACLEAEAVLAQRRTYEQNLIDRWQSSSSSSAQSAPDWIGQLVLSADQFIVERSADSPGSGQTLIAGYPWFGDWGRDTMISLPGLTLTTGRPDVAAAILRTFARYIDQGMLPNRFPDRGETPEYNTVDATLWYFEAVRLYYEATADAALLEQIFPVLAEIIDWHCRGTRYNIHLDTDGLLYAGEEGVQLTWMDAKVDDWVVTPRIGKPVEINALWYSAVQTMVQFAQALGQPAKDYAAIATRIQAQFNRFWHESGGHCYDLIDGPDGDDASLRPNQIFAVALPLAAGRHVPPLLTAARQKQVVDACGRALLTSYGLRSLAPHHANYHGQYGGDRYQRDGAYHQGTVWGWLLGPFALAHFNVYGDRQQARTFLEPMAHHLHDHGIGSLSEIFDGDPPFTPRGCPAQAWSVAEVLRAWSALT